METIVAIIAWIAANWTTLVGVLVSLLSVASVITGFTKTPKDDSVVKTILMFVRRFSGVKFDDESGTFKTPVFSNPEPKVSENDTFFN